MSTATSEFVMDKILEAVSQEDFRYIGIVATDTRDTVFLAGLIHRYCPDVQVFAPEGDLLVAHPSYSAELRGMILASSYPLFSMIQRWDPPYAGDRRRHLFASQENEGTYNATVLLLLGVDGQSAVRPGNTAELERASAVYGKLFDYGPPFDELKDLDLFWPARSNAANGRPATAQRWRDQGSWELRRQGRERPPIWLSTVGHAVFGQWSS